jgi:hypothetical protein
LSFSLSLAVSAKANRCGELLGRQSTASGFHVPLQLRPTGKAVLTRHHRTRKLRVPIPPVNTEAAPGRYTGISGGRSARPTGGLTAWLMSPVGDCHRSSNLQNMLATAPAPPELGRLTSATYTVRSIQSPYQWCGASVVDRANRSEYPNHETPNRVYPLNATAIPAWHTMAPSLVRPRHREGVVAKNKFPPFRHFLEPVNLDPPGGFGSYR